MIVENSLIEVLSKSQEVIEFALSKPKFKNELTSLPKINEIFTFFFKAIEEFNISKLETLPPLPVDLKNISNGIFLKDNYLICASTVSPISFKYDALYIGSLLNQSCVQLEMSGVHISILTKCADGIHYEPIAFSYLLRDDFFTSESSRFIVPFLNLPTTLPLELEFQWVYLAIRELSMKFCPAIEYKFLADDDKEINLLKQWGVY